MENRDYIYLLKLKRPELLGQGPTAEEEAILHRHAAYLKEQAAAGAVHLFGRTDAAGEATFGIVVFRAGSEETARMLMEADPAVAEGVMGATLHPFRMVHPKV